MGNLTTPEKKPQGGIDGNPAWDNVKRILKLIMEVASFLAAIKTLIG